MITYIAIYMLIGLVVGICVLLHQYYILNRSIIVEDIVVTFAFCFAGWPLVVLLAILESLLIIVKIETLLNKVVIEKRKIK